jgi:tape measure domain-containing protein
MNSLTEATRFAAEALVGYNAKMQQTSIAYSTLIGNAGAAKLFIEDMKDFASKTPFEFEDVDRAAKKFLAMGWSASQVIPDLTAVGNAASALGLRGEGIDRIVLALGQMNIKAKISGEEIRQLNEAGIGAQKYLADAFNLTSDAFDDMSKTGISGAQAVRAIIDAMKNDPKFKDMMQAQSKTMLGMWSTVKDNMKEVFGAIGDGAFESVNKIVAAFAGMTDKLVAGLRGGGGIAGVLDALLPREWAERIWSLGIRWGEMWDIAVKGAQLAWAGLEPVLGLVTDLSIALYDSLYGAVVACVDALDRWDAALQQIGEDLQASLAWMDPWIAEAEKMNQSVLDVCNRLSEWTGLSGLVTWASEQIAASFDGVTTSADRAAAAVTRLTLAQRLAFKQEDPNVERRKDLARERLLSHVGTGGIAPGDGKGKKDTAAEKLERATEQLTEKLKRYSMDELEFERWKVGEEIREYAEKGVAIQLLREYEAAALGAIAKKELENEVAAWTKEVEEYQRKADAKIAIDNKMGRALVDLGLKSENAYQVDQIWNWFAEQMRLHPELQDQIAATARRLFELNDAQNMPDGLNSKGAVKWGIDKQIRDWGTWSEQLKQLGMDTAQSMQGAFSTFFFDAMAGELKNLGDYFGSFLKGIARAISNMMANALANKILGSLFGSWGGSGGSVVPNFSQPTYVGVAPIGLSGQRAAGGPVNEGENYLVGENGPEIFNPNTSGTIIPNSQLGKAGAVVVNVYNQTGNPMQARSESSFDGARTVVSLFLEGYARNISGIRTLMPAMGAK